MVNFGKVAGKCHVVFSENLDISMTEWTSRGPNRFYFSQAYNIVKQTFEEPPFHATSIGMQGKVREYEIICSLHQTAEMFVVDFVFLINILALNCKISHIPLFLSGISNILSKSFAKKYSEIVFSSNVLGEFLSSFLCFLQVLR